MGWSNFDDVLGQMQAFGLDIEAQDVVIGTRRRCRAKDGGREKRGWFQLYELPKADGSGLLIVGSFGCFWGVENVVQKVELPSKERKAMSSEQLDALKARIAADKKRAEAESERIAAECSRRADFAWRMHCKEGSRDQSEYLKRKQIEIHGGRFLPGGKFCIPVQDSSRRTYGLQVIYNEKRAFFKDDEERDKSFWPKGLAKKGNFFLIGGIPDRLLLIAEGFATAASLHQATKLPVAVAFDAGNLLPVAKNLRAKYKRANILICADDDYVRKCKACKKHYKSTDIICPHCKKQDENRKNEGITAARNAALAVEGEVVFPVFTDERPTDTKGPTDFNDLHLLEGRHVVAKQIEATLTALGWPATPAARGSAGQPGGGEQGERRQAQSVMDLDDVVERFVPLDDGTGDYVFDTWTNKVAKRTQMIALLAAGVRGDDIKRHPVWITRGAYYLDQVGFDPSTKDSAVKLNTWRGWPTKPHAGECERLLETLWYLCGKEDNQEEVYNWILNWMAYPLQNPGAKMASAIIMHGPQGTGKSSVFQTLAKIYGDYSTVLNQRGLEDKFNSDWSDSKLFILAEEVVTRAEMWHIKNELKELVTGEWIRINPKNIAAYRQRNQVNIAYLSNENQPLPLDNDDRRHLVVYTPPALSEEYYDALYLELENNGPAAFYDYLLRRDLSGFHPKKRPPMTQAKKNLVALSQASEIRFVNDWITGDWILPVCPCLSSDLYAAYLKWCRINGESRPRPSNQFFGAITHQQGWEKKKARYYAGVASDTCENRPVVFPPDYLLESVNVPGPDEKSVPLLSRRIGRETVWLGECVRRFSDAISTQEMRAAA